MNDNDCEDRLRPAGWRSCRCPFVDSEENDSGCIESYRKYEFEGKFYEDYDAIPCDKETRAAKAHELGMYNKCSRDDAAFAAAGDYYMADFFTGPNFGCIHHQEIKL